MPGLEVSAIPGSIPDSIPGSIPGGGAGIYGTCQFWKSRRAAVRQFWKGKAGHRSQAELRTGRPLLCWKPVHKMVTWLPSPHRGRGFPCRGSLGEALSR